jgi:hypothetical protein
LKEYPLANLAQAKVEPMKVHTYKEPGGPFGVEALWNPNHYLHNDDGQRNKEYPQANDKTFNEKNGYTAALSQQKSKDTFDVDDKQHALDPQDASMYDDQHTYNHKAGSWKNTVVKGALL